MSKILNGEPYVAENFILPYLSIHDIGKLSRVSKACNTYLDPRDEYCPIFADVFAKYTGKIFDESLDW